MLQKIKDWLRETEWVVSLASFLWGVLQFFGVPALVIAMFAAVGLAIYSVVGVLGWAGWVLAATAAAIVMIFLVGLLGWARAQWTRVRSGRAVANEPSSNEPPETQQIRDNLRNHSAILFQHAKDTEEIHKKLKDMTTTFVNIAKDADASMSKLGGTLESKIQSTNDRIEKTATSIRYENTLLAEKVFALRTTYEMRQLRRDIERLIVLLDRPLKQDKDWRDWTDWTNRFKKFEQAMQRYASLAETYYPKEAPNLTWVPPGIYRIDSGDFAPDQFPDHQTAHDFKTFRKMSDAYENLGRGLLERIEAKT